MKLANFMIQVIQFDLRSYETHTSSNAIQRFKHANLIYHDFYYLHTVYISLSVAEANTSFTMSTASVSDRGVTASCSRTEIR